MGIGKRIRLNRLFAHPSGRLCSIAVDHFIGYTAELPAPLKQLVPTLQAVMAARPDAVTMHKGLAAAAWYPYAGQVPLILQSSLVRPDDTAMQQCLTPDEALRLGADAIAVVAYVRGASEAAYLRTVAEVVREAARWELPVVCHTYPRAFDPAPHITFEPEEIAWATHCAAEMGVDIIKVPYCGDVASYSQIVAASPVPVVAAGGPKALTLEAALGMIGEVMRSGARGATIGRNVWGFPQITCAVHAFKAVIHDSASPEEALRIAGI